MLSYGAFKVSKAAPRKPMLRKKVASRGFYCVSSIIITISKFRQTCLSFKNVILLSYQDCPNSDNNIVFDYSSKSVNYSG